MQNRKWLLVMCIVVALVALATVAEAQCPMCRISLESNLKNGGSAGKTINRGIFLLLAMPYLFIGGIAFVWWRNRKVKSDDDLNEAFKEMNA
jgi:hypothetical protein